MNEWCEGHREPNLDFWRRSWSGRDTWEQAMEMANQDAARTGYRFKVQLMIMKRKPTWRVSMAKPPRRIGPVR